MAALKFGVVGDDRERCDWVSGLLAFVEESVASPDYADALFLVANANGSLPRLDFGDR